MSEAFAVVRVRSERKLARVDDLEEIIPLLALTPLEQPSGSCRGMANLRGVIVPVFDLAGPEARLTPSRCILVCRTEDGLVGLIADEIDAIVDIPRENLSTRAVAPGCVVTLARMGEALVPVIEPSRIFDGRHANA